MSAALDVLLADCRMEIDAPRVVIVYPPVVLTAEQLSAVDETAGIEGDEQ